MPESCTELDPWLDKAGSVVSERRQEDLLHILRQRAKRVDQLGRQGLERLRLEVLQDGLIWTNREASEVMAVCDSHERV